MKIAIFLLFTLSCAGCATAHWNTETKVEESAFLTLHAVDGLQTANICHTPHRFEAESTWALGREPRAGRTAAYFALIALGHIAITNLMIEHHAPEWIIRTWELGGIAWDVRDVAHNAEIGITP